MAVRGFFGFSAKKSFFFPRLLLRPYLASDEYLNHFPLCDGLTGRVTISGEFLPNGQWFSLPSWLKITEVARILGLRFP
jgi:hypothetical protein